MIPALLRPAGLVLVVCTTAAGTWLDVPFLQQGKSACGPASAAMVMQYWALHVPALSNLTLKAERIAHAPVSRKGTSGEELRRLLESEGFRVFVFQAEVRDLAEHLEKGRPLIVCFAPEGKKGLMHFAVVSGLEDDAVLLNDPVRGKLFREPLSRFLPQWRVTANWTLLAVPRTGR